MHVWIVQTGEPLHCDEGISRGMRAMNTADALVEAGHKVTIWSSDFYHQEKRHRFGKSSTIDISGSLTIKLIPSCGYTKNVSLRRFKDHKELAENFLNEIKTEPLPDVALVGFPPIEIALKATEFLESNNVPVLLDVKDQWPDIFEDAVPLIIRPFAKFALRKLYAQSKEVMSRATALCSMSTGFLDWAAKRAGRCVSDLDIVCPLTTPSPEVSEEKCRGATSWWKNLGVGETKNLRLIFVGSLSRQFDFMTVLKGVRMAAQSGVGVEVVVCGTGEMEKSLRGEFSEEGSIIFAGWIDYPQYKTLANMSDIALAPYINNQAFQLTIPNKIIDALSFSLPILSPLDGDVGERIANSKIGWKYNATSSDDICKIVSYLSGHECEIKSYSINAKKMYDSFFEFTAHYESLVCRIVNLAKRS